MNKQLFLATQLRKDLEDMKPGRKRFPTRNWHYLTNIGRTHQVGVLPSMMPDQPIDKLRDSATFKELETLRYELKHKEATINQLKTQLSQSRNNSPPRGSSLAELPYTFVSKSIERPAVTRYLPNDYGLQPPPDYTHQCYFTRNAPKPWGENPITGLARSGSSYNSPLRATGAAVTRRTLRPCFN